MSYGITVPIGIATQVTAALDEITAAIASTEEPAGYDFQFSAVDWRAPNLRLSIKDHTTNAIREWSIPLVDDAADKTYYPMSRAVDADIVAPWLLATFGIQDIEVIDAIDSGNIGVNEYKPRPHGGHWGLILGPTQLITHRLRLIGQARASEKATIDDAIRRTSLTDRQIAALVGCDHTTVWRRRQTLAEDTSEASPQIP